MLKKHPGLLEARPEPPPFDYSSVHARFRSLFGHPLGEGRNRTAFLDGGTVVKVPNNEAGCYGNMHEAGTWDCPYEPRAKAWVDEVLTAEYGICILRMEYVEPAEYEDGLPDWTMAVDCCQVGYTLDGRLVAYDWERC